jgi:hypothetical protein
MFAFATSILLRSTIEAGGAAPPLPTPPETAMDNEHVTPLPQTTSATAQEQGASGAGDLQALMLSGHALIGGCQAVNAEMLAFWQSRLKDGLATAGRLLECTSAESALEVQLDYAKAALQAHLDQSARITALVVQALTESLMPEPVAGTPKGQTSALAA